MLYMWTDRGEGEWVDAPNPEHRPSEPNKEEEEKKRKPEPSTNAPPLRLQVNHGAILRAGLLVFK